MSSEQISKIKSSDLDHEDVKAESVSWPSRCKWSPANRLDSGEKGHSNPHNQIKTNLALNRGLKIQDSILDWIGQTPLVRMSRLTKSLGVKCELLAKCEFLNPGGSVKDRIAVRMVEEAERVGKLVPFSGHTIIEPTSGNTGIGLAMVAARRGYQCIIVMPEKMSAEKERVLKALGAKIVRTRTSARFDDKDSHISKAIEIQKNTPHSIVLNQFRAPANPLAHYDGTAEEILAACDNKLDAVVAGVGTGGTISGLARKIKERLPECKMIGVDPVGSILAQPDELNSLPEGESDSYLVEGIGDDFIPTVMDRDLIDKWYKSEDGDSLRYARDIIKLEGMLVGGSSGAALCCAIKAIEDLGFKDDPDKRVVVVLSDSVRNYMTRFIDDDWMTKNDLLDRDKENGSSRRCTN